MTTKLYGAEKQRLYTAAEARCIDMERGGEGKVKHRDWDNCCYLFLTDEFLRRDNSTITCSNEWLPVTPEPEMFAEAKENVAQAYARHAQEVIDLKAEIESLKANQKAPWRKCGEEKPRNGYIIVYKGPCKQGFFSMGDWWSFVDGSAVKLDQKFAEETLSWKYVEEL